MSATDMGSENTPQHGASNPPSNAPAASVTSTRSDAKLPGNTGTVRVAEFRARIVSRLFYQVGGSLERASNRDWFVATALATRDEIVDHWRTSNERARENGSKHVCYMSLEFLIGRLLVDALGNLGMTETAREALAGLGADLDRVCEQEADAALGNGGLGRLAACFMESMASVDVPAYGYGIRYEHGLFRQAIREGEQQELPEDWLSYGNPWEFERTGITYDVGFGGQVLLKPAPDGREKLHWQPAEIVRAVAYDTPIIGWRARRVNTLRLWSARATDPLRLAEFNRGDYLGAYTDRVRAEAISRVLYPSDETPAGQELRLRQEYFFASASLQDLMQRHIRRHGNLRGLSDGVAIQLNDTHPAIAVAELMRLLVDVHGFEWGDAWDVARRTFSYTNHTLMPEALEMWPVSLMERLLPRIMQIVYLINVQHLDQARSGGANDSLLAAVSVIDEHHGRRVRMGHLAFIGSHHVNGVSALHTELMRVTVFADLDRVCPRQIVNKTNGITFRRWLFRANPGLTRLLVDTLGEHVLDDPEALQGLVPFAEDASFQADFHARRRTAKRALSNLISARQGILVDPEALFDVQIKRVHEYKRQLLNILQAVSLYNSMRAQPMRPWVPRVKIFAGKAAASYHRAKLIIRLAHDVARVVNSDPTVRNLLKIVFLPNYNVSLAETIIPAADLSEQISTAGLEASGTGNMKLALNGAITIGTMDGANVEIRERVGAENIFIFGLSAEEAGQHRQAGFNARAAVETSSALSGVLDAISSGVFSPGEPNRYRALVDSLLHDDTFLVTADFDSYEVAQRAVAARWLKPQAWWRSSILNTANVGWFSSDRTIREYAADIWGVPTH